MRRRGFKSVAEGRPDLPTVPKRERWRVEEVVLASGAVRYRVRSGVFVFASMFTTLKGAQRRAARENKGELNRLVVSRRIIG